VTTPKKPPPTKNSTGGTSGTSGTGFDIAKLSALTGQAKVGAPKNKAYPHDQHDPDEAPDRGMNLRTNAYDRALFAYVAGLRGTSVQQTIRALARQAALQALDE